jgi:hypothetical protein
MFTPNMARQASGGLWFGVPVLLFLGIAAPVNAGSADFMLAAFGPAGVTSVAMPASLAPLPTAAPTNPELRTAPLPSAGAGATPDRLASGVADAASAPAAQKSGSGDKKQYWLGNPTPHNALRPFTTDRPDVTESPYTVDAGHFQVELSLADYAYDRTSGTRTRTLGVLPINLKVGLSNNIDIQFVFTPYRRVETRDAGARSIADGFGDQTQIRLKINLWGNDGGTTAFAVIPFVKLPTEARGLGNNRVEGGLILPLAIALPDDFSLGTMAEFDLVYDDERRNYGVDVVHSATLGHPIIGKLAAYIEYVGNAARSGGYRATASGGLTWQLADNCIIDGGGTLGLAGAVDDMTIFAGVSIRF